LLLLLLLLRLGLGTGHPAPLGLCLLPRRLLVCLASLRASVFSGARSLLTLFGLLMGRLARACSLLTLPRFVLACGLLA